MASTRKGYKVPATVIPVNDLIPVADSNDIAGNLMYFDNLADINNIPITKRKLGMFVYVSHEGKHYKLIDNKPVLDARCWEEHELVSKKYVDNAISSISGGGGSTTPVDAYTKTESDAKYALKTDIPTVPDTNNFATKDELNNFIRVKNMSIEVDGDTLYPLSFNLELPEGSIPLQVIANSEIEDQNILASIDYRTSPITIPGMETNEFGIAIAGSKIPTTYDFE